MPPTNAWGNAIIDYEPPRQDPDEDRVFLSCQARGRTVARRVTFPTACGYTQTAIIAAAAVQRILEGRLKETGFVSPARAFGARYLIEAMADEGYHCQVENSI